MFLLSFPLVLLWIYTARQWTADWKATSDLMGTRYAGNSQGSGTSECTGLLSNILVKMWGYSWPQVQLPAILTPENMNRSHTKDTAHPNNNICLMTDFLHSLTWNRRVTMPTRMFKINCEVSYFFKVYYKIIKCSLTVNLQKTAIIYVNYLQFTVFFLYNSGGPVHFAADLFKLIPFSICSTVIRGPNSHWLPLCPLKNLKMHAIFLSF